MFVTAIVVVAGVTDKEESPLNFSLSEKKFLLSEIFFKKYEICGWKSPFWSNENLYSLENGRNNNVLKNSTTNSKVTQIMTPMVNVNEHTTYTNLLHILHNRLSEA